MTCHRCGALSQFMGTTYDGEASVFVCPICDDLQIVRSDDDSDARTDDGCSADPPVPHRNAGESVG